MVLELNPPALAQARAQREVGRALAISQVEILLEVDRYAAAPVVGIQPSGGADGRVKYSSPTQLSSVGHSASAPVDAQASTAAAATGRN